MIGNGARETFAARSESGHVPIGMFVACSDPAVTEILGYSGYDFAIFDGEHSWFGIGDMLPLIRSAELTGMVPLVRLWENTRPLIQKVIDAGGEGVVLPHVETAEEVVLAVAATRFPPHGVRSLCPAGHGPGYTMRRWDRFAQHSVDNFLVIPIIESERAVENLDEILDVDGVDWILFGPGDLSLSMGVSMTGPEISQAWKRVLEVTRKKGKHLMVTDNVPGLTAGQADAVIQGMDVSHISELAFTLSSALRERLSGDGVGA